jgi:hypothetical protein
MRYGTKGAEHAGLAMIVYDSEKTVKEIWYKGKITGDAFTVEAMTIFGRN